MYLEDAAWFNDKEITLPEEIQYLIERDPQSFSSYSGEGHLDRVIPIIRYGVPYMEFADSDSINPEFYLEYPIFSSATDLTGVENHTLYKKYYGGSQVQVIPTDVVRQTASEVVKIGVYTFRLDYINCIYFTNIIEVPVYLGLELDSNYFEFNKETGVLTLNQNGIDALAPYLADNNDVYLKVYVEKYRLMSDLRDLSAEQVDVIAAMQSIHAKTLEYMYQFQMAQQTESILQEIAYTARVTIVSTILTLPIMFGAAKLIKGASAGAEAGKVTVATQRSLTKLLEPASMGYNTLGVVGIVLGEVLEEIYIDPLVGAIGAGIFAKFGLDNAYWAHFASSLFESGRETALGPFKMVLGLDNQGGFTSYMEEKYFSLDKTSQDIHQDLETYKQLIADNKADRKLSRFALPILGLASVCSVALFAPNLVGPAFAGGFFGLKAYSRIISHKINAKQILTLGAREESLFSSLEEKYSFDRNKLPEPVLSVLKQMSYFVSGAKVMEDIYTNWLETGRIKTLSAASYDLRRIRELEKIREALGRFREVTYLVEFIKTFYPELVALNFDFSELKKYSEILSPDSILKYIREYVFPRIVKPSRIALENIARVKEIGKEIAKSTYPGYLSSTGPDIKRELDLYKLGGAKEYLLEKLRLYIKEHFSHIEFIGDKIDGKNIAALAFYDLTQYEQFASAVKQTISLRTIFSLKSHIQRMISGEYKSDPMSILLMKKLGDYWINNLQFAEIFMTIFFEGLEQVIDDFIFYSDWSSEYIYDPIESRPEYELLFNMYHIRSLARNERNPSFKNVYSTFKIEKIGANIISPATIKNGRIGMTWRDYKKIRKNAGEVRNLKLAVKNSHVDSISKYKEQRPTKKQNGLEDESKKNEAIMRKYMEAIFEDFVYVRNRGFSELTIWDAHRVRGTKDVKTEPPHNKPYTVHKHLLEYDGYCEVMMVCADGVRRLFKIAFEYDGSQHDKYREGWRKDYTEDDYYIQRARDRVKDEVAEENGVILIRLKQYIRPDNPDRTRLEAILGPGKGFSIQDNTLSKFQDEIIHQFNNHKIAKARGVMLEAKYRLIYDMSSHEVRPFRGIDNFLG